MIDEYIYIYNPNGLEYVNVMRVFEDPREVHDFKTCDGSCYDPQSDYPLPADMLSAINLGLLQGELQLLSSAPTDKELNRTRQTISHGYYKRRKTEAAREKIQA